MDTPAAPAAQPKPAPLHRSQPELIYKTRVADNDDSPGSGTARKTRVETRVADDDRDVELSAAASAFAKSKTATSDPWWKWVEKHCEYRQSVTTDAVGQVLGEFRAKASRAL